ncbi:hyaluronidase PH-20-like isoform X2 [Salarias fasciatus]|uniref:Hyaluronidase n=2 Tax=Salarias fasciatus TaxID=181472 RepID=A0A672H9H2_SALFA|nr:hyaluronidase PH-20-like isoform X2 [Salarias fasciatus]
MAVLSFLSCVALCIVQCVGSSASSSAALPATEPPMIHGHPFVAIWNAPTEQCAQLDIPLDTAAFQAVTTTAAIPGQFLTIFYEDRLGFYPKVDTSKRQLYSGGIPQTGNLTEHLAKARGQIDHYISQDSSPGLAVIDWESWRPLWEQNWGSKQIYQKLSVAHAVLMAPFLSSKQISTLAKRQFQQAGRRFMERTISLGVRERPSRRWGFYLFPDCHNYNYDESSYTGRCSKKTQKKNDQLLWLWQRSTALFPSIYLPLSLKNSAQAAMFVRNRVQEALRVAALAKRPYTVPIYAYARPMYRIQTQKFLSQKDLVSTVGESAALGASGVVMWGSVKDYSSKADCQALSDYLTTTFSPYVANVTAAAMLCGELLCQKKGRCVRKRFDSSAYLHLNATHFHILRANGRYAAVGQPSSADLEDWGQKFTCQCYAGQRCSARLLQPDSIRVIWV